MIKRYLLLFSGVLALWPLIAVPSAAAEAVKRQVQMELEEVPGASSYEIELTSKRSDKVLNFRMREPLWKANVRPGDYMLRLRSYDARGVPGDWSDKVEIEIKLPGPRLLSPDNLAQVKTSEEDKAEVALKWSKISDTKKYRVEVTRVDAATSGSGSAGGKGETFTDTFDTESGTIKLPVAASYKWKVTPIGENGQDGEPSDQDFTFTVIGGALETPDVEKPDDIYVDKLTWEPTKHAETYSYILQRKGAGTKDGDAEESAEKSGEGAGWVKVDQAKDFKGTELPFPTSHPGGKYRFLLRAENPLRQTSKTAKIEFDVFGGDRSPAAVEEFRLRDSLEKPSPYYFIASWLVSSMNYDSYNAQGRRPVTYKGSMGGTGRLGIGYINPKTKNGYYGLIDQTGATLDDTTPTWMGAEAHKVWRLNWGRNMIRPSVGVFYKQMVELLNTGFDPRVDFQKISYFGPHIGAEFWRPISPKLGVQANVRLYMGVGGTTPNGQDLEEASAFQVGLMGSYRLTPTIMGFMGWAHREDHAKYLGTVGNDWTKPAALPGTYQDVNVSGDFLNFILEVNF